MPAFVTAQPGLWSDPATWTTVPPAGGPGLNVGDNDTVTINHAVTHDRAGITWLGTGVAANAAIQINAGGALRMDRATSGTLRCWGNVIVAPLGTIDFGTIVSPIPAGIEAALEFRSTNQFGLDCQDNSESYFVGTPTRTRWTRLVQIPAANVMRVADATGWQVDDYLFICSSSAAYNSPYLGRITAVVQLGPNDWQVTMATNVNTAYSINKPVGSLGANVRINGVRPAAPYALDLTLNNASLAGPSGLTFTNTGTIRPGTRVFRSMRIGCGGQAGNRQININNRVLGSDAWDENRDLAISSRGGTQFRFSAQIGTFRIVGAAIEATTFEVAAALFQGVIAGWHIEDFAWSFGALANGSQSLTGVTFKNGHIGGTFQFQANNSGLLSDTLFEDIEFGPTGATFGNQGPGTGALFRRCIYGLTHVADPVRGYMESSGTSNGYLPSFNASCSGVYTLVDCEFDSAMNLDAYYSVGGSGGITNVASPNTRLIVANKDQDPSKQTIYTPDGWFKNDAVTFRSGPYSLRYTPNFRNRPQSLSFGVLAPDGAQVPVSGFFRRDTPYSTAGTIVATLSGPGITPVSYTSSGAPDTWEQFAFNVVQNTGFPAVLTLTITFTGATGDAWVDDIVAPSSQAVSTGEFSYWQNGQPLAAILANFSPAADVWNIPTANLTLSGSVGQYLVQQLANLVSVSGNTGNQLDDLYNIFANIEGGNDVRAVLRLLLAVALGDITGAPGSPVFKSLDGTVDRVVGTALPSGDRTRTSLNPS